MNTRSNFDSNLKQLKQMLLDMGQKAEFAVKEAMQALLDQDLDKARKIIPGDKEIDQLDSSINDQILLMIAKESPVASDLRKIIASIKISSEVERIADNAVNIAKSTLQIGKEKHIKEIYEIPKMMDIALDMLSTALTAYYAEDVIIAKKSAEKDDLVDKMYGKLIRELHVNIPENPAATNQITQLAYVCRYIERIADHTTNIAENVIFLVTGKRYDLNA